MIQMGSVVKVIDNSGVMRIKCIKVLGTCRRELIGERVIGSVQRVKTFRKVRRGHKVRSYIVGTPRWYFRLDGSYIRMGRSCVIVIGRRGSLLGSRVRGPVMREFKDKVEVRTLGVTIRTI